MKYKRIYIAGAYNADNVIKILNNIKKGTRVCVELILKGYCPFCPWLDYNFHWFTKDDEKLTIQHYYDYCMGWLEVSDCVLVLPNSEGSKGTQAEIKRAEELGIKVFYKFEEII